MMHIYTDAAGVTQLGAYLAYLDTIRHDLPRAVADFATDERRYTLDGDGTLHDAWLEAIEVVEPSTGARHEIRRTEITLRFLGPRHDRRHLLRYHGVRRYRVDVPRATHGRGDLLTHDVRMGDAGAIVHEIAFAGGGTVVIECAGFRHEEEPVAAPTGQRT